MNKQSNAYTIIYASVMVIIVAAVLAFASIQLRPFQSKNVEIDKMKQILSSVNIASDATNAQQLYTKYIVESYIIDESGSIVSEEGAFNINIAEQVRLAPDKRKLPVFVCQLKNGSKKYIMPMYGAGLWGPLWGYVSVDENGSTIYGAYFAHQGETPGLGAEIERPIFSDQYKNKQLFIDGVFKSVAVEKKGQTAIDGAEQVDAIAGGTITSKGVQDMMKNSIAPYQNYLKTLK